MKKNLTVNNNRAKTETIEKEKRAEKIKETTRRVMKNHDKTLRELAK